MQPYWNTKDEDLKPNIDTEKILIIQTAFLGDLILTTPFFHQIRKLYPNSTIHLLVNKGTESVLDGNPDIDRVFTLDKKKIKKSILGFWQFAKELKKEKYTIVYSPHFSYRSSLLSWLTSAKERIGYKESGFSFLHTKKVHRPRTGPHEVEKLFSLLWDNPTDYPIGREKRPFLFLSKEIIESAKNKMESFLNVRRDFVCISPSSLWETKRYPAEGFAQLIQLILENTDLSIILTGSPADSTLTESILNLVRSNSVPSLGTSKKEIDLRILDLAGKTSLSELGAVISMAKVLISNDSSPVHYGSAFNTATVLIYGATVPDFGYSTVSEKQAIAEIKNLYCRPCSIHGGRVCPEKHFRCMKDQKPEEIFALFEKLLI